MKRNVLLISTFVGILILGIVWAVVYYATGNKEAEYGASPFSPEFVAVREQPVKTYEEYPASLEGEAVVELYPMVDGYLHKIFVDEGGYVEKGVLLFQIDDRIYRQRFRQAQADYNAAIASLAKSGIEVDNSLQLFDADVISDVQLSKVKADHAATEAAKEQAHASMTAAQTELEYTSVHAPVNGYVGRIPGKIGSRISTADPSPITTISRIDNIRAYFYLSEKDYRQLTEKMNDRQLPVELIVDGIKGEDIYRGAVETTGGSFEKNEGRMMVRASIPNKKHLLRSGGTGKIRIETFSGNALVIPKEATYRSLNKTIVYLLTPENTLQAREIMVREYDSLHFIVESGLSVNDKILRTRFDRVQDGMEVTVYN
jgi:membrane fusion protein (multidrug efflux system)